MCKMARIVKLEDRKPMEIKVGNESKWICMCGLTKNRPFCDGSHKQAEGEKEGKIYKYENGKRIEVKNLGDN